MNKHIKVLIVSLLVLAGMVFIFANPLNREEGRGAHPLFEFAKDDVGGFEISNFVTGLKFARQGDEWTVSDFKTALTLSLEKEKSDNAPMVMSSDNATAIKADPVQITSLLTRLEMAQINEPIASEKKSHNLFQINEHSLNIKLFNKNGMEIGHLFVGKTGPDFMSSYVKRGNEKDIYLLNEDLQSALRQPKEQWLYKPVPAISDNAMTESDNP